jgi:hypothetical protein
MTFVVISENYVHRPLSQRSLDEQNPHRDLIEELYQRALSLLQHWTHSDVESGIKLAATGLFSSISIFDLLFYAFF